MRSYDKTSYQLLKRDPDDMVTQPATASKAIVLANCPGIIHIMHDENSKTYFL